MRVVEDVLAVFGPVEGGHWGSAAAPAREEVRCAAGAYGDEGVVETFGGTHSGSLSKQTSAIVEGDKLICMRKDAFCFISYAASYS